MHLDRCLPSFCIYLFILDSNRCLPLNMILGDIFNIFFSDVILAFADWNFIGLL